MLSLYNRSSDHKGLFHVPDSDKAKTAPQIKELSVCVNTCFFLSDSCLVTHNEKVHTDKKLKYRLSVH